MKRYYVMEPWEANEVNRIDDAQVLFDGEVSGLLDEEGGGIIAYGPTPLLVELIERLEQ